MSGFSTLLLQGYGDHIDQNAKEYGSRIAEASERMDLLLRDLLDYGRICHTPIFSTRLPLDRVVDSVVRQFALKIESSAARMQVSSPLAVAQGDRKMVEEIVSRLLSNALKFVPPGKPPEISVYSELRNGLVRLYIEDNGIGIEPELQHRIFGVFERGTTDRQYPGTGIGLAIVRRAVERMRGSVGLMSKPGEGSRFWIELPAG